MSTREQRRERFIKEHPFCCCCGGGAETSEIDHNPPRALFSAGAVPKGFRFPCCGVCNDAKKDAESRAALISTVFSRVDPPDQVELARAVQRGLAFVGRESALKRAIVDHPSFYWDFARGTEPGALSDPSSALEIPHELPEEYGQQLFELGRFFGQAMYYRKTGRPTTRSQLVGVTLFTNAISQEAREALSHVLSSLEWHTPHPADRRRRPEFHVGERYFDETETLFFAGEREAAFLWFGLAGPPEQRRNELRDYHWWRGDGSRVTTADEV